jgi:Flp pilus assembly protein TadG
MRQASLYRLFRLIRLFRTNEHGNIAITFGMLLLPLIGFVGAAVDYSRANAVKASLQSALDATALAMSKSAASMDSATLQSSALKYFQANFAHPEATNVAVTATYNSQGGTSLTVNGSVDVPTVFMGLVGVGKINLNASNTAKWGNSRLRVALVLDNTGSMADSGKMSALQTATKNLLSQLKSAASVNGDVYVSIVPFVKDVNVDPANAAASWIDWTAYDASGICKPGKYKDKTSCTTNGGTWTTPSRSAWNGCVVDRGDATGPNSGNYDTNVAAPDTSIQATLFSAEQYSSCPQAAKGLSYDWAGMTTLVNNMSPAGNTNQAIGLALGWMSLVGGGPFSAPAMASGYTYQQIIILLTDGLNTQDRWYSDQASIDARQSITCSNIKTAGITLYTIQVNTGGDPTSTLLKNCASDSNKYFLLTSADQIVTTFNQIGTSLTQLYLSQ